jgi:hypothetical protein
MDQSRALFHEMSYAHVLFKPYKDKLLDQGGEPERMHLL